ncbi:alpha/beta hydrolase [Dyella solisilvae]|nr:alpha/beta hydrolase [Dyella solisilvae]
MALPRRLPFSRSVYGLLSRVLLVATLLPLGGCEATLFAGLNATDQHHDISERHAIPFDPAHGLALDVYAPAHASHAPVVVFFYGGDWARGQRAWYRFVGTALAAQGVVTVIPDYRKVPQVTMDGFMQDAAEAVAWTHAHAGEFGGSADDVFVMGHSAGGQIAALLATDARWLGAYGMRPAQLAGFIGLAGCYDFVPVPPDDKDMIAAFGRSADQQRLGQPVSFVHGEEPPMLLLQGTEDHEVEPSNAISLAHAMQLRHEDVTLRLYPGVGHGAVLFALSRPMQGDAPTLQDVLDFVLLHPTPRSLALGDIGER